MALIPKNYLDAVAVLEDRVEVDGEETYLPLATGTLLSIPAEDQSAAGEDEILVQMFLATNRHVIEGKSELWIRFNQGSGSQRFRVAVEDNEKDVFSVSKQFDLAISHIRPGLLRQAGAEFAGLPQRAYLDLAGLEELDAAGGDGVFVLGFPMGITGVEKKYAVVRSGVIARLDREIVEKAAGYLIDCPVFPGNSGGPVILKPETLTLGNQPPRNRVHVIGIVSGYLSHSETAISQQTQRPRITFEENSGLANVVPMDAVMDLITTMLAKEHDSEKQESVETQLGQDADGQ